VRYNANPELSIVIPTKDRPELLLRALASVEAQAFQDFEVLVVDDGDGRGAEAAEAFAPGAIRTLITGGAGQVPARNLGVGAALGRHIAFLDDDDWWAEDGHLGAMLGTVTGPALLYASGRIVAEGNRPDAGSEMPFEAYADAQAIRRDNRLLVPGVIYPRALHENLGPFDETLPYYWDWDWYLRLFAAGLAFIGPLSEAVRVSARDDSVSAAANLAARQANLSRLAAKHDLGDLTLRNHESIARDGNRPS
jgi:glycosyltransferase involved in cell wall biosynthesis